MTTLTLTLSVTVPDGAIVVPTNGWERFVLRVASGLESFVRRRAMRRRESIAADITRDRILADTHAEGRRAAVATGMGL